MLEARILPVKQRSKTQKHTVGQSTGNRTGGIGVDA